jgi:MSHA biogenesis protein MshK
MAGGVMQQGIRYLLTAFALTAVAADTFAQQLRDPTRPPSFVAPAGTAAVRESDLVLQTVLISPERRAAIINGRLLRLGENIAGMQLMSISESEVQLRGRGESRTLHLFPAVNRRETRPPAAGSAGG